MIKEENISKLINGKLSGSDKFLVSVKVNPGNRIVVYIDSDTSVTIDDCAGLSRFIESQYDREAEDYELEVSSAGLSHPLILQRQYKKNIGRKVKTVLKNGTVRKGIIKNVSDNDFELLEENTVKEKNKKIIVENIVSIAFSDVKETKLIINL
ncbi:MAG TPA: ribosome assembly cofactor RimP [Bacteroidales bacterium]|nr:ribosome assembly cofactor RimP [Bacteroidales bacterium]HPS15797.1 ribosome assembly cofactor RimP [Bacteroidales bacterium]